MKNFIFSLLIIIGLSISMYPTIGFACSCAETPFVQDEFERSHAVFTGKVLGINEEKSLGGRRAKSVLFSVEQTWKGITESQVIIKTGMGDGDCGIAFVEGEEYFVYAVQSDMYGGNELVTTICDRTNEKSAANEDLSVLGEGKAPEKNVELQLGSTSSLWSWAIGVFLAIGIVIFWRNRRK